MDTQRTAKTNTFSERAWTGLTSVESARGSIYKTHPTNQYLEVVIQNAGPTRYTIDTKKKAATGCGGHRCLGGGGGQQKNTPSNESYKNWFAFSKIGLTVSLGNSSRFRGATALNQIMTVNQVERKLVLGKNYAMCCMTKAQLLLLR